MSRASGTSALSGAIGPVADQDGRRVLRVESPLETGSGQSFDSRFHPAGNHGSVWGSSVAADYAVVSAPVSQAGRSSDGTNVYGIWDSSQIELEDRNWTFQHERTI